VKAESEVSFTATINEWRKIRAILVYEGVDMSKEPIVKHFMDLLGELGDQ
jgi:hypothetical protein